MGQTIEVHIPSADWAKELTAVSATAKTGFDWDGEFLKGGQLIDLEPGTIVVTCSNAGSRKHPVKDVDVRVLMPDGSFSTFTGIESNEWASSLRKDARKCLEMDPDKRVKTCAAKEAATWGAKVVKRAAVQQKLQEILADTEKFVLEAGVPATSTVLHLPQAGTTDTVSLQFANRTPLSTVDGLAEQIRVGEPARRLHLANEAAAKSVDEKEIDAYRRVAALLSEQINSAEILAKEALDDVSLSNLRVKGSVDGRGFDIFIPINRTPPDTIDSVVKKVRSRAIELLKDADEKVNIAHGKFQKYERMAKTKRDEKIVTAEMLGDLIDDLKTVLAELLTVCGSQEKIVEVLRSETVRRAVAKALKPPKAAETAQAASDTVPLSGA